MNIIFGMLFLMLAFSSFAGVKFAAPYVGQTTPGSPAATTFANGHADQPAYQGLRPGDHITAVNGKPIEDLVAVKIASALGDPGQPVALTIARDGEAAPLTYHITPVAANTPRACSPWASSRASPSRSRPRSPPRSGTKPSGPRPA